MEILASGKSLIAKEAKAISRLLKRQGQGQGIYLYNYMNEMSRVTSLDDLDYLGKIQYDIYMWLRVTRLAAKALHMGYQHFTTL